MYVVFLENVATQIKELEESNSDEKNFLQTKLPGEDIITTIYI